MQTLKFLGKGSRFASDKYGCNSAYIIRRRVLYLFDCGDGILDKLKTELNLKMLKKIVICITHNHDDHTGSLSGFIFYSNIVLNIKPILVTHKTNIASLALLLSSHMTPSELYDITYYYTTTELEIKPELTSHKSSELYSGIRGTSSSFLITIRHHKIYFSGDSDKFMPTKYIGVVNEYYQDVSLYINTPHLNIQTYVMDLELFSDKLKDTECFLMHIEDEDAVNSYIRGRNVHIVKCINE